MIEVKRIRNDDRSLDTVTNFEGSPHELLLDFMMLQKALKRPQLKLLWDLASMMCDDLDVESKVMKEKYQQDTEEDLKA